MQKYLSRQANYSEIMNDKPQQKNVSSFGGDLPGDLKQDFFDWLIDKGYKPLADGVINA